MKAIRRSVPFAIALAIVLPAVARASIKPASLFTDNAVLQRNMPIPIWGTADPNEPVTVSVAGQRATTRADLSGVWSLTIKPLSAGGPYTMTIAGAPGDVITLSNVLVGEVWVCSGQSNMEFGIRLAQDGEKAIAGADNPEIRIFNAGNQLAFIPQSSCPGKWAVSSPETLRASGVWGGFSAIGYFFGRDIQAAEKVPVGLIQATRGGTMAAPWTSREALSDVPSLKYYVSQYDADVAYYGDSLKPENASQPVLKALFAAAKRKYDLDNAPVLAQYNADVDAAKANYAAAVDAARAAGQPAPPPRILPRRPRLPLAPHDFSSQAEATQLFNGIISPLIPYAIRGVIWYQGESNGGGDGSYPARSWEYKTLFPTMIADWRSHWREGDMPFYFVQLAPYDVPAPHQTPDGWAEVREAQRLTAATMPSTAMAVITDLGNSRNVHPKRKEAVGDRLALIARALTYGEKIEYSGPVYTGFKVEGSHIRVSFSHAAGLHAGIVTDEDGAALAAPDKLAGFAVAGADRKFYPADATISGAEVVVSSPAVSAPLAVRYGFANFPAANLQNDAGLFASPFKGDDWPWSSLNNHG